MLYIRSLVAELDTKVGANSVNLLAILWQIMIPIYSALNELQ